MGEKDDRVVSLNERRSKHERMMTRLSQLACHISDDDCAIIESWRAALRTTTESQYWEVGHALNMAAQEGRIPDVIADLLLAANPFSDGNPGY